MKQIDDVLLGRYLDNYIAAGGTGGREFRRMIQDATTEEKKGKWRRVSVDRYVESARYYNRCSECNKLVLGVYNFCPHCGIPMEDLSGEDG